MLILGTGSEGQYRVKILKDERKFWKVGKVHRFMLSEEQMKLLPRNEAVLELL